MSDERLRSLQRTYLRSREANDQAELIVALLRTGRVRITTVALAAYAGHEGARLASGIEPAAIDTCEQLAGLVNAGGYKRAMVVTALAACRVAWRRRKAANGGPCGQSSLVYEQLARAAQQLTWEKGAHASIEAWLENPAEMGPVCRELEARCYDQESPCWGVIYIAQALHLAWATDTAGDALVACLADAARYARGDQPVIESAKVALRGMLNKELERPV